MTEFWHKEAPQKIAAMLRTDLLSGLSEAEAYHRLNEFGLNVLTKQNKLSAFTIFLQQFSSLVIWVLLGTVVVSFALNDKIDAIAIFSIVFSALMLTLVVIPVLYVIWRWQTEIKDEI